MIALSAIVSGVETALFSIQPHHERGLAGKNRRLRAKLRLLLRRAESGRITILFIGALLNLGVIVLGIYSIAYMFDASDDSSRIAALIGLIFAMILVGDIGPKMSALAQPAIILRWFASPTLWIVNFLHPLSQILRRWNGRLEKLAMPQAGRREAPDEDEFEALVEIHREEGALEAQESALITEIIKLGNKTTKDCMTPRVDAFAVPANMNRQQLQKEIATHDAWRIPMYGESRDTVTGILDVRAFLQQASGQQLRDAIEAPVFVPETMRALTAFRDFLHEPHSMVIVLDEYGGTEGVLTHENVIQQIIGEATPTEDDGEPEFRFLSYDRLWASGTARLDALGKALGVKLEREGLDTISGLVFHELGHLPKEKEEVIIGSIRAVVLKTGSKRVEELVVERLPETNQEDAA